MNLKTETMTQLSFFQTESATLPNPIGATLSIQRMEHKLPDPDQFDGLSEREADQWASYSYSKPRPETRRLGSRSHIIALYDPFAARKDFPAGRRWCVNVLPSTSAIRQTLCSLLRKHTDIPCFCCGHFVPTVTASRRLQCSPRTRSFYVRPST